VNGIAQKEFSNTMFYSAPEFYLYLKRSSNDYDTSLALNFAQSQILMNRKVTNPDDAILSSVRVQSLLNPDNIHIFFFDYTLKKYDAIKLRFGLSSNRQVDAMYGSAWTAATTPSPTPLSYKKPLTTLGRSSETPYQSKL
jgi:hypothetical protein